MRIAHQPAFVLHHRPYRETSVLLDVFTSDHGRLTLVARGVRKQHSTLKPLLQPFVPLLISWQGRTELMTMTTAEPQGLRLQLKGECLLSGLYLNELIIRVLHKQDPHPELYKAYQDALQLLQSDVLDQRILRRFEHRLLQEVGYGLHLDVETIQSSEYYRYHHEVGFTPTQADAESIYVFSGASLLSLAHDQLDDPIVQRDAKRLMRIALMPLLGERVLESRKLFQKH